MSGKKINQEFLNILCLLAILLSLTNLYIHLANKNIFLHTNFFGQSNTSYNEDDDSWKIIIDLDELTLFVYKNEILIKTYPCSGGKNESPSPTGQFKIISKEAWGEGFGGVWMGLNVPWGTYGIHGTNNSSVIGIKNISHGCIRMLTQDAKELADIIPLETSVIIIQENKPFITRYYGDTGSEIWNAQVVLYDLGYYNGELDGKFGVQFRESVIIFQKENGLKETGSLNKKTYDKILEGAYINTKASGVP